MALGGPAQQSGRIMVGDTLRTVNGYEVIGIDACKPRFAFLMQAKSDTLIWRFYR